MTNRAQANARMDPLKGAGRFPSLSLPKQPERKLRL